MHFMSKSFEKYFVDKVAQTIKRHDVIPSRRVIVALSGGRDSVALLRVLTKLSYECEAIHCNFSLRGEESLRDEKFVKQLCKNLGVYLTTTTFDTRTYALSNGISIEMAARELRYGFFNKVARDRGIDTIAVAHHREDNAETILLNMIRGTGLKGLTGMAYRRDNISRPLLDVSRKEIKEYLNAIDQDYVDDSTNEVADVKRNFVRLEIMPLLRHLNPSITETLVANGQRAAEAMKFIEQHNPLHPITSNNGKLTIKKSEITSESVLFDLLNRYGFSPATIENIYAQIDDTPGAVFDSDTHRLLRDRDCLMIKPRGEEKPLEVATRLADVSEFATMPRRKDTVCLDADKVGDHLETRFAKKGDRFVPLGMKGSKLVSDYLTDRKADLFSKQSQTVLTNGKDIVWLVGRQIDDRYKVVEGVTKRLLICSTTKQDNPLSNNINKNNKT